MRQETQHGARERREHKGNTELRAAVAVTRMAKETPTHDFKPAGRQRARDFGTTKTSAVGSSTQLQQEGLVGGAATESNNGQGTAGPLHTRRGGRAAPQDTDIINELDEGDHATCGGDCITNKHYKHMRKEHQQTSSAREKNQRGHTLLRHNSGHYRTPQHNESKPHCSTMAHSKDSNAFRTPRHATDAVDGARFTRQGRRETLHPESTSHNNTTRARRTPPQELKRERT